jgi:hypothetical protein
MQKRVKTGRGARVIVVIAAVSFAATIHTAYAETIELNDGSTVVGEIVHETDAEIVVSQDGGKTIRNVQKEKVGRIRESSKEEIRERSSFLSRIKSAWGNIKKMPARLKAKARKKKLKKSNLKRYEQQVESAKESRKREKARLAAKKAREDAAKAEAAKPKVKKRKPGGRIIKKRGGCPNR